VFKYATSILKIFFVYVMVLSLVFAYNMSLYQEIISYMYPEALPSLHHNVEHMRFAYLFFDPNSAAYFIVLCLSFYLLLEKKFMSILMFVVISAIPVLLTQSRGGFVAFSFVLIFLLFFSELDIRERLLFFVSISLLLFLYYIQYQDSVQHMYIMFSERLQQEDDFGGGRLDKYKYFIENFNFTPFGVGYNLHINGFDFRPHSDLIRLNLSYGIVAIPLFAYFVYPRYRNQYLLFFVMLAPFFLNTAIDNYRIMPLYFLVFNFFGEVSEIDAS